MRAARRALVTAAAIVVLLLSAVVAGAQGAGKPLLLALAKKDEMVAVVDPSTLKVLGRIPAGGNPHEVLASPDGRTAWITNYGNGALNTITVVDVRALTVLRTIDLAYLRGPHGLAYADGHVWFTAEREKLIGRLNDDGDAVDRLLGTGQTGTHMLWVSADATEIVTANVGSGTLEFFERRVPGPQQDAGGPPSKAGGTTTLGKNGPATSDWDQATVKVGGLPEGFDVITDQAGHALTIWVANAKEGTVSIVDFASRSVIATVEAGVPTANRLRFAPAYGNRGSVALISREKAGELTVVDIASRKVLKRVVIGTGAAGVLVEPGGARAFVSCSPDDRVMVVDLKTFTVTGSIAPGHEPDGLAWVPETR